MLFESLKRTTRHLAIAGGLSIGLIGCAAVVEERGYVLEPTDLDRLQPGQTSKIEVEGVLGSPSTVASIKTEGDAWFYISSTFEKVAFYAPEEVDRKVVAIYFDPTDRITEVANYGLEDGQVINFSDRATPTRGKKLTLLGQIFSNVGRFNNSGASKSTPGR